MKWGKSIGPISNFISDKNSQQSSTRTPVLLRVTDVAFFFSSHKLKTKPYTRKKIRTCFVAVFAFCGGLEPDPQYLRGVHVKKKILNLLDKGHLCQTKSSQALVVRDWSFPNFRSKTSAVTTSVQHRTTSLASAGQKYKEIRGTQVGKSESCHT